VIIIVITKTNYIVQWKKIARFVAITILSFLRLYIQ